MPRLRIKYRDIHFNIDIDFDRTINDLFSYLENVVDIDGLKCRLLIGGKSFVRSDENEEEDHSPRLIEIVKTGTTAMLLASTSQEVDSIRSFKPDPLLKGLNDETTAHERRLARTAELLNETPWGSRAKQDNEYRFERFEVLYKRTDPPPFAAEKLLLKLAVDPGIVSIMKSRRFKVLTLCEMDPLDADAEQAQKGEGDKCLLGWNRNHGERIALRLRTNDLTSFRKYDSIVTTLIHELVHNVFAEHNDSFWGLFNELKNEYQNFHQARKNAPTTGGAMAPGRKPELAARIEKKKGVAKSSREFKKPSTIDELRDARLQALARK